MRAHFFFQFHLGDRGAVPPPANHHARVVGRTLEASPKLIQVGGVGGEGKAGRDQKGRTAPQHGEWHLVHRYALSRGRQGFYGKELVF
jgi:hypothetical protein